MSRPTPDQIAAEARAWLDGEGLETDLNTMSESWKFGGIRRNMDFKTFDRDHYQTGALTYFHRVNHIFRINDHHPICGAVHPKSGFGAIPHYHFEYRDCKKCLSIYAAEHQMQPTDGTLPTNKDLSKPETDSAKVGDSKPTISG